MMVPIFMGLDCEEILFEDWLDRIVRCACLKEIFEQPHASLS